MNPPWGNPWWIMQTAYCVCQGSDPVVHTHYQDEPHGCARCVKCNAYQPLRAPEAPEDEAAGEYWLGFVCERCGWWIKLAQTEDAHCRHLRLTAEENLAPEDVAEAKRLAGVVPSRGE